MSAPLYSLAHLTLIDCSVPELIYIAARSGYRRRQPSADPHAHSRASSPVPPEDRAGVRAMKTALDVTGIKVLDIELARITEVCDPPSFEPAIELGAEIGAKHMIMSAWTQDRHDRSFLIDCYAETCEIAHNYGLTVDLEFPSFSRAADAG